MAVQPHGTATQRALLAEAPAELYELYDLRDLRGHFRAALCARQSEFVPPCDTVLVRHGDEPPAAPPQRGATPAHLRIGIVPGLFAECGSAATRPLSDAAQALRDDGFVVHELLVAGRGRVVDNGRQLAEQLAGLADDERPLLLFAYSKGLPDLLEALRQQPAVQKKIAAVVGWAGAAQGARLAEHMEGVYRAVVAGFPLPNCAAGNGDELTDLTPAVRAAWWTQHGKEIGVPLYSIVSSPDAAHVSPGLTISYNWLSGFDPRNDGKLLWHEQIMAPGSLLAFVNADHWGAAIPLTASYPVLRLWVVDDLPRAAVMRAAIEVVADDLSRR